MMADLKTRFSVGDVVYHATTTTEKKRHPCPDCKGEGKWKAVSPAGCEYSFACPRCGASYKSFNNISLSYTAHVARAQRLTIGSVRVDTHAGCWGDEEPNSYMCQETGVGSGNIYRESRLFTTEDEALRAAEAMAAKTNAETEWIVKQYDQSLDVSDYQLESAGLSEVKRLESRARSMIWNIGNLFATIEEAEDKDAILEAIADYKNLDWENDKRDAAQGIEARSDETPTAAQPAGQEPDPVGDAPTLNPLNHPYQQASGED